VFKLSSGTDSTHLYCSIRLRRTF